MSDELVHPTEPASAPIRVVHVESTSEARSWWPVWMLGASAALIASLSLAFTLITTIQGREDAERRADADDAVDDCWARLSNEVTERQQSADNALNDLVVLITRQILATEPPVPESFGAATERLEETNRLASAAVDARTEWLDSGSLLPCPL